MNLCFEQTCDGFLWRNCILRVIALDMCACLLGGHTIGLETEEFVTMDHYFSLNLVSV